MQQEKEKFPGGERIPAQCMNEAGYYLVAVLNFKRSRNQFLTYGAQLAKCLGSEGAGLMPQRLFLETG